MVVQEVEFRDETIQERSDVSGAVVVEGSSRTDQEHEDE